MGYIMMTIGGLLLGYSLYRIYERKQCIKRSNKIETTIQEIGESHERKTKYIVTEARDEKGKPYVIPVENETRALKEGQEVTILIDPMPKTQKAYIQDKNYLWGNLISLTCISLILMVAGMSKSFKMRWTDEQIIQVLMSTGILLWGYCSYRLIKRIKSVRQSDEVQGAVIKVKKRKEGMYFFGDNMQRNQDLEYPVIAYLNHERTICHYELPIATDAFTYKEGQVVTLLINEENGKHEVYINSWIYLWAEPILCFFVSGGIGLGCLMSLIF